MLQMLHNPNVCHLQLGISGFSPRQRKKKGTRLRNVANVANVSATIVRFVTFEVPGRFGGAFRVVALPCLGIFSIG